MKREFTSSDHVRQFRCVQKIQQRPKHRALRDAEKNVLRRRQLTVIGDLLSATRQERVDPVKDDTKQSDCRAKTLQQDRMDKRRTCLAGSVVSHVARLLPAENLTKHAT